MKPELGCWGAGAAVAVAELAPPKLNTEDGAAGVEVAPAPKAKGLLLAAGFEVADPNAKGDAAAAVVTAGAAAGAAAPKENGEVAAAAAAGWLPPAAAGVFPKENTLPVEAALVTDGNAMVGLLAAPPNEKLAVVVWA